jgi:uncharacterized protein YdiU (UPF0061 family)
LTGAGAGRRKQLVMDAVLQALRFDNRFVRELPADSNASNQRRQVLHACYSRVAPTPVAGPKVLAHSREVAELVGIESGWDGPELAQVFSGNRVLAQMQPYAACYGGHQFGTWAGQLGDGRAITLGEVLNARGERWELQLKGAGPTPYSRTADGRAVMRSSVREFLCSEAMHHLGVPTTRALCLVGTGEPVVRDMFYDGNARPEPGAVVCRVAPSFLRFGNFELPAARGDFELLRALLDYTLATHFAHLGPPSPASYARCFEEICHRTAVLMTHWMRVGFVHGVMNTDNMSILGLTIDYGPYGWLEGYDPGWTPNTTDAGGRRYRYGQQPRVGVWNLAKLASAFAPLVGSVEPLETALHACLAEVETLGRQMMQQKLGLPEALGGAADSLIDELPEILGLVETDMTIFFRKLGELQASEENAERASDQQLLEPLTEAYYAPGELTDLHAQRIGGWLRRYLSRVRETGTPDALRRASMHAVNPKYVLRNYMAQLAIDKAEQGDGSLVNELLQVLRHPYDEQPGQEAFAAKRPEWARHRPGCSMLSCSS